MSNFDKIRKSTSFFKNYYSIESVRNNSFKAYKFIKTGVHGKYILLSSRAKFKRFLCLKFILVSLIKRFYFDFVLSNCPSDIVHYSVTSPVLRHFFHHLHKFNISTMIFLVGKKWCFSCFSNKFIISDITRIQIVKNYFSLFYKAYYKSFFVSS